MGVVHLKLDIYPFRPKAGIYIMDKKSYLKVLWGHNFLSLTYVPACGNKVKSYDPYVCMSVGHACTVADKYRVYALKLRRSENYSLYVLRYTFPPKGLQW